MVMSMRRRTAAQAAAPGAAGGRVPYAVGGAASDLERGCISSLERWGAQHGMSPATSAEFASGWRSNAYSRGNILFYQGNEPFGLFFICSGRVKLVRAERDGRRQIVRIVYGPDFVGERALIARQPYAATAEVMTEARIGMIDSARFFKLWLERPELPRALARHLASHLGTADGLAADMALHTIRERLAKVIAHEAESAARPGEAILLTESRQELAELLGTSPEVVSRTLKEMRGRRLIALEGSRVRVLDAGRLRAAAGLPARPLDFYPASAGRPGAALKSRRGP